MSHENLRAVILTALPVEFEAVRSFLSNITERQHPQGNVYEQGTFSSDGKTWDIGIAEIGAGNPMAAMETERAIEFFKPQVILFVGIAGGIKDVNIGDVVAATKIYGYESGKAEAEVFKLRPELGKSNYPLVQRAKAEARSENQDWLRRLPRVPEPKPNVKVAPIAAGEKVIAATESDVCQFIKINYNDAIAVEMEGYGFLEAAYANQGVSAIVVRGISDLIDNKNSDIDQESEEIRQEKAALHASAFAFQILANFDPSIGSRKDLPDSSLAGMIGKPQASSSVVRRETDGVSIEDLNSAHLVIAIFWKKPSERIIRIRPRFYCHDINNHEILHEDLFEKEDYSESLKKFPEFLTELVKFTLRSKIPKYFDNSRPCWQLVIKLFVPVDLLGESLETWCGKNEDLIRGRSIVVGCSDRFNRDQPALAIDLRNQLNLGWQRFQQQIPDQAGQKLKDLTWLTSAAAHQESLQNYSGFQCYGDWLKPDKDYLKNWLELVRSGIPIALWMCAGNLNSLEISRLFDHIIDCTRFEFLERIQRLRHQHRKTCNYYVGVFYEDPNYVPDDPLPVAEHFFTWPGA
jgi:nucleoside phosphorylase